MVIQSSRLHAKALCRKKGQSAVAAAAYRSGQILDDNRTGKTFDYTRKQAIEATKIIAPTDAPDWVMDRSKLWNNVEAAEKRKDAQLAREVQVAIPEELPKDVREKLVWDFCQNNFVAHGMIADVAIHAPGDDKSLNWHFHAMLTMRSIGPDGFGLKERRWNENHLLQSWKQNWQKACNEALQGIGSSTRVDLRSIEDRHAEQLRFALEAKNWIDRARYEIEAERLNYTARPNLPQKAYRAAAKGNRYPGYEKAIDEWNDAIESRDLARAKATQLEAELNYMLSLSHNDGEEVEPVKDQSITVWLTNHFEVDPAILAIMAKICDEQPKLSAAKAYEEASAQYARFQENSSEALNAELNLLEGVGRRLLTNSWMHITHLEKALQKDSAIRGSQEEQASPDQSAHVDDDAADEEGPSPEEDLEDPIDEEKIKEDVVQAVSEVEIEDQPPSPETEATASTKTKKEAQEEARIIAAEKAERRRQKKIERKIVASQKRVLRGRKTINTLKGAVNNIRHGKDMFKPYSLIALKDATGAFLAAATTLAEAWDALRKDQNAVDDFASHESDYIKTCGNLEEMHQVVARPSQMDGEDLIEEQARLEELRDFFEQSLIRPFINFVKKRLKTIKDYLTSNPDGIAKAEAVAEKIRLEEEERQAEEEKRQLEMKIQRQRNEMRRLERIEQNKKRIATVVLEIIKLSEKDRVIRSILASYKHGIEGTDEEIASDPFWFKNLPDSSDKIGDELIARINGYHDSLWLKQLKKASEEIERIIACANRPDNIELSRLISGIDRRTTRDHKEILEDPLWIKPVESDPERRRLWEVAKELTESTERRERLIRQHHERIWGVEPSDPSDDPSP